MSAFGSAFWTVANWFMANLFNCIFWPIALIISGLFARYAIEIWPEKTTEGTTDLQMTAQKYYRIWFNLIGSLVGWLVLWILIGRYRPYVFEGSAISLSWWDLLGGFIAFVGITGHLPWSVVGIIYSLRGVAIKVGWSAG